MPPKEKDIRKRIHKYDPNSGKEPESTYETVNFMASLLDDIKYSIVYGNLEAFLNALKRNVDAMNDALPQKQVLQLFIQDLLTKLSGKPIELRVLFQRVLAPLDPHFFVVDAFQKLASNPNMKALCLPFLNIQAGHPDPIPEKFMTDHIRLLGRFSLYELFFDVAKKSLTCEEREAIEIARKLGIFSAPPTEDGELKTTNYGIFAGGTNSRTCDPVTNTCKVTVGGWCNSDASGSCSAMST
jgi:hypothetical protein